MLKEINHQTCAYKMNTWHTAIYDTLHSEAKIVTDTQTW